MPHIISPNNRMGVIVLSSVHLLMPERLLSEPTPGDVLSFQPFDEPFSTSSCCMFLNLLSADARCTSGHHISSGGE